jgi:DNA-binding winged helix-turn-helix (wHTH) protein
MQTASSSQIVRFGTFEIDLRSAELRKNGLKLRLAGQPFQVLSILLERPGEVVSREELQKRLWPDTFVDVDHSLNMAINKIREVLDDSADTPRFVETLPRRGYRFIAPIMVNGNAATIAAPAEPLVTHVASWLTWKKLVVWSVLGGTCILAEVVGYLKFRHTPVLPSFTSVPFTALPGVEISPAFSPDGAQIAFGWTGEPASDSRGFDLYVKAIGSGEASAFDGSPV